MSLQTLREQVLHLLVSDRLTLMSITLQSLTHELNFQTTSENNLAKNHYPLRGLSIQIAEDFDESLPKFGIHSQNNSF